MTDPTRQTERTTEGGTATRRRVLALTGGATLLGAAGCLSSPSSGGSAGDGGTSHGSDDDNQDDGGTEHDHESGDGHDEGGHHGGETTEHHGSEDGHHEDGTTDHGHEETTESDVAGHSHHDDHHHHEKLPEEPQANVEVKMITTDDGGYHFEPHLAWVEEGGTVTFVNESGSHSATAYHPDNDGPRRIPEGATAFDTGTLTEGGAEREYTLDTPGVYDYYCIPHERLGMLATVLVGDPDPHDQPGLSEPDEDLPAPVREKIADLNDLANRALGHEH